MRNKEIRRSNLLALIKKFGKTSTLAKASGANADYISQIANKHRDMGDAFAKTLEVGLQLSDGWMDETHSEYLFDNPSTSDPKSVKEHPASLSFNKSSEHAIKLVPHISWPKAGANFTEITAEKPKSYLSCPIKHGDQTFCISVKNDSMTAAYGKSYPINSIVFIDPGLTKKVQQGHRVFARLTNGEYVFKELAEDAGKLFLRSLNPQYQPILEKFDIIGKIIGKWETD